MSEQEYGIWVTRTSSWDHWYPQEGAIFHSANEAVVKAQLQNCKSLRVSCNFEIRPIGPDGAPLETPMAHFATAATSPRPAYIAPRPQGW